MKLGKTARGIIWMILAQIVFVTTWTAIKTLGKRLPLFEIIFFRAFFSSLILLPLTHWRIGTFRGHDWITIFLRSLTGVAAMIAAFYTMIHIELGNAATLLNTLPIFVAILAPSLLGEPFRRRQFLFVLIAFAGILFILKPDAELVQGNSLIGLLAGFLAALAMLCLRKLRHTDNVLTITLHFTLFTALVCLPFMLRHFIWPTREEWFWLAFIGFFVTFAQLFMARAYHFGRASTIAPFAYISVIGSYIAGLVFFTEVPDLLSAIGSAVVIVGGVGVMLTAPPAQHIPGSTPGART